MENKLHKIHSMLLVLLVIVVGFFVFLYFYLHRTPSADNTVRVHETSSASPFESVAVDHARTNFSPKAPADFPADLPIEKTPVSVIYSYEENFKANQQLSKGAHTQITYSYVTKTSALVAINAFAKYFTDNGFTVEKNYDTPKMIYALTARKGTSDIFNIRVAGYGKDSTEQVVSVGEIIQK